MQADISYLASWHIPLRRRYANNVPDQLCRGEVGILAEPVSLVLGILCASGLEIGDVAPASKKEGFKDAVKS